ncbi:zinc finger protein 319 [Arapaima gigas]
MRPDTARAALPRDVSHGHFRSAVARDTRYSAFRFPGAVPPSASRCFSATSRISEAATYKGTVQVVDDPRLSTSTLNPYSPVSMTEAWQQHAVAPPPVVHTIPPGAENTLGCAVGGEGGHKCGACGHDISHLANPHEHQCLVSQDRSFQCTQCLKIFHQATDLLEHQCVQVEQKPFVCGVCKMGFSLLTSLAQHHNAHSSSNPMKCSICEKTYRPSSSGNATPTPTAANPQQPGGLFPR